MAEIAYTSPASAVPKRIAVVSVGRSDYEIYQPVLRALAEQPGVEAGLLLAGAHLAGRDRAIFDRVAADEHQVWGTVNMTLAADAADAIATGLGLGALGFAAEFGRIAPDLVLILGDRFETFAAAAAVAPLNVPLAHLHGGEVTEGALDERFRHAITKLSHLHFVSTPGAERRVRQMGEEPWRVTRSGAPGIDQLLSRPVPTRAELFAALALDDPGPFALVTFHPETVPAGGTGADIAELLSALDRSGVPAIFTLANADQGGRAINQAIRAFVAERPRHAIRDDLGSRYPAVMAHAALMLGNSSSGIIEACSFGLPVVNVGDRQAGRERSTNVIDCAGDAESILGAIERALAIGPAMRADPPANVYGDGQAGLRIAERLASVPLDARLLRKRFCDLEPA